MRIIRKLLFASFLVLVIWGGITSYNKLTDGFSIYQMSSSLPPCPQFHVELSREKKLELQQLLEQKFYYLGKGCQCYVFESEDKTSVIKFFKHKHLRLYSGLESLPLPAGLRQLCGKKISRRKERVHRLLSSCKLAYEKLSDESGLLYVHMDRVAALEKKITLVDKLGCKHSVDIDAFEYIIQKKGLPLHDVFARCDPSKIPTIAQQLASLVIQRCEKGVCDRDPAFAQNISFCNDKPIFIDIGQFYEDESIRQKEAQTKELENRFADLRWWMDENYPQYTAFFVCN
jgi:hypothetical protein